MNLQDIQADHTVLDTELKRVKDKIQMREAQIGRLERKKEIAHSKSHWTTLVNNIMSLVAEQTPHVKWKIGDPFVTGMRCQYYIFGKTIEDDITVAICFTPDEGSNVRFDTGEEEAGFQRGSIGNLNGFDQKRKRLENIQELVDLVKRSEETEKIRLAQEA